MNKAADASPQGVTKQDKGPLVESLLLVDDERNILLSLRRLFKPLGYTIHLATSGREGLAILKQHPIDLIISDMRMPEMDGAQFLEEASELYPDTVRILLTGYADMSSTIDAINKGRIYRYLSKPWEETEVVLTVRQALLTKRLEWEKQRLTVLTERQNAELQDLNDNLEAKVKSRTEELQQTADMLDLAYSELNESYEHTIQVFSSLIGMRERLSGRYGQKVAELARAMAKAKQLDPALVREVYFAGLLHELGKLSLPDFLLEQPVFSFNERGLKIYQRHPINGQNALMAVEALQSTGNLIRAHEEYCDGSGFPDGLKGDEMSQGARILSIAKDYYGYQSGKLLTYPLSTQATLERIQRHSGQLYDPALVKVLTGLVEQRQLTLVEQNTLQLHSENLQPGMELARDLYNNNDQLLLTKGRALSEMLIQKLIMLERLEKQSFEIYVHKEKK